MKFLRLTLIASILFVGVLSASTTTNKVSKLPPSIPAVPVEKPPPSKPAKPVSEAAAKAEMPVPPRVTSFKALDQKGKIEKIQAEEGIFVIEGKEFKMSPKGKVFVDGGASMLREIKEGDLVAVTYFAKSDGSNMATRLIKGYRRTKKKGG